MNGGMQLGPAPEPGTGEAWGTTGRRKGPAAKATALSIEGRMFGHMQLPGDGVTRRS